MRAKFIYEEFKENSDPIDDMGIGASEKDMLELVKKHLEKWDAWDDSEFRITKLTYSKSKRSYAILFNMSSVLRRMSLEYDKSIKKYILDVEDWLKWIDRNDSNITGNIITDDIDELCKPLIELMHLGGGGFHQPKISIDSKIKGAERRLRFYKELKKYLKS